MSNCREFELFGLIFLEDLTRAITEERRTARLSGMWTRAAAPLRRMVGVRPTAVHHSSMAPRRDGSTSAAPSCLLYTTGPTLRPRPAGPAAQPETPYRRLPRTERLRRSAERRRRRALAARAALQQRSHPMQLRRRTVQLRQEYLRLFTEWSRLHAGDQEVL